jgi:hypothetical protein
MLNRIMRAIMPSRRATAAELDPQWIKRMVRGIVTAHPDELGCDECFEELDQFVEMELAGQDAAGALPLVQDHLERCLYCREEFEALLSALQALA